MSNKKRKSTVTVAVSAFAMLVLSAIPAYADLCVPLVFVVWPASWLFTVCIVPVEAAAAFRLLGKNRMKSVKMVAAANVVSALAGIPLLIILSMVAGIAIRQMLGVETPFGGTDRWGAFTPMQQFLLIITQGPLLISSDNKMASSWVPVASVMVLCIPAYFLSVWCEYLVGRWFFDREQWGNVRSWAWIANACSYLFILIVLAIRLLLIIS